MRTCAGAVCRMRGRTSVYVAALGRRSEEESENELDWLLSMGLMWATDLKTGLNGAALVCGCWRHMLFTVCCVCDGLPSSHTQR